jgi:glycosyltransferase involved in cell wall biosynthesis
MRVGISCYPTWGGSGVVASELAMALARGGDEAHVISYALPTRLKLGDPSLHFHEVNVPHYPLFEYPPYSLALATTMVEVARHHQLDLIHVHYAVPNAVSAVLAREILEPQPLKVVTTLHGTDITLTGNDPSYLEGHHPGADRRLERDPRRTQLHRARALRGGAGERRCQALGATWREDPGARFQLSSGQAGARRGRGLREGAEGDTRATAVGGRRARPAEGRAALPPL